MLHSFENLTGASVIATDGLIGTIYNVLIDDQSWMIRYLVVDVKSWLSRRDVILAITALDQFDWTNRVFRVQLTKEQVRHSPDVDSMKPVSRQQEIAMREYYGWPAWTERNVDFPSVRSSAGREYPVVGNQEDPHLRSGIAITGYEVWAAGDGKIGRLETFIVDENSWHIGYLYVRAGDWLQCRSVLFPTGSVSSISWADHRVHLDHSVGAS